MAVFDREVAHGVSANLCDAVVGLWGSEEIQRSLEFSFSWSPGRAVAPAADVQSVVFSGDRRPGILAAATQMREREPLEGFDLRGPVVKLERTEEAPSGKITVVGLIEGRQTRVTVELPAVEYDQAVEAHRLGDSIQLTGILVKQGRGFVLQSPSGMKIERE